MCDISTLRVHIQGVVQGVGFRPFVYSAAMAHQITGWVRNSSAGVEIIASGQEQDLDKFLNKVQHHPPPLARIDNFKWAKIEVEEFPNFSILESEVIPGGFVPVSTDIAICEDCKKELFDPRDHRYRYPFINCTNCGPRLTIIKDIPYDRPATTMAQFPMCPVCSAEYHDPTNRRFHAQPIACADCGPQIWFVDRTGNPLNDHRGLLEARNYLKEGKIIAVKGLGGFHLACDATNQTAVTLLRERKKRSEKPFAVMGFNMEAVEKYCRLNAFERSLLQSKEKPIVIVPINRSRNLPSEISPGRNTIGVMLGYTPLHLLLLEPEEGFPDLFVMTSGNVSDEPITFTNEDALERLSGIADGFLLHDRHIHTRVDDTVLTAVSSQPYFIRRSRGYAPQSIRLPENRKMGLAVGAELKNTFCVTKEDYAFVSHHIGDLKNYETYLAFTEGVDHYQRLFRMQPEIVACDLHPEYLSTRFAHTYAEKNTIPLNEVQHHHAHLASCLADNGYFDDPPVIGVIFDGTGFGTDGNIWGGEFLIGNAISYDRAYHLDYMPLPGGDHAVVNPSRIAISYLIQNGIDLDPDLAPIQATDDTEIEILQKQRFSNLNTPLTAGMGRLFDAVASLICLRQSISYEAQAAIELEQIIATGSQGMYPFRISGNVIKIDVLIDAIRNDLLSKIPISVIAAKFHESVARLVLDLANKIRSERGINLVALSGGVWQNEYLLIRSISLLESDGFTVFRHQQVPANDGGISLGQAAVINAVNKESR